MRQSFFARRFRQLLLPSVIAVICACNPSKFIPEAHDTVIEIVSADTANVVLAANGQLIENSRDDTVYVYPAKNVTWFIDRDARNVKDFYIERKNVEGSKDIFTSRKPPSKPTKAGGGKVRKIKKGVYIYSIIWTDSSGTKHTFDPIIAIMPS